LWECLTGARLFDAATDVETIDAVRSRRVLRPSALRPEVPPALDEIALRALARDPGRRHQSAHELSEELDRFLVGRDNRPSTKTVGQWIESIFGSERAALKKAISQGDNAEGALQRLNALEAVKVGAPAERSSSGGSVAQPRALWSTNFGAPRAASSASLAGADGDELLSTRRVPVTSGGPAALTAPRPRGGRIVIVGSLLAVAGLAALGAVALRGERRESPAGSTAPQATASLDLRSRPEGASIFVDGRPTGLRTPAVLSGLPAGRTVKLRIDLPGYLPASRETTLGAGQPQTLSFALERASEAPDRSAP
jgi:serine/threonine-protein kinase